MQIPIRCFTCGKEIASSYADFIKRVKEGEKPDKVLADLKIHRWCCRRLLVSHIDLIDEILPFS